MFLVVRSQCLNQLCALFHFRNRHAKLFYSLQLCSISGTRPLETLWKPIISLFFTSKDRGTTRFLLGRWQSGAADTHSRCLTLLRFYKTRSDFKGWANSPGKACQASRTLRPLFLCLLFFYVCPLERDLSWGSWRHPVGHPMEGVIRGQPSPGPFRFHFSLPLGAQNGLLG